MRKYCENIYNGDSCEQLAADLSAKQQRSEGSRWDRMLIPGNTGLAPLDGTRRQHRDFGWAAGAESATWRKDERNITPPTPSFPQEKRISAGSPCANHRPLKAERKWVKPVGLLTPNFQRLWQNWNNKKGGIKTVWSLSSTSGLF